MSATPTIVIADDASEVRLLIRTRFRLAGAFDVVGEASDGVEAVELASRHRPELMLLDVSMPRMDGLTALPRILEVSPETRVVLFSGFEEQGLVERALSLGAAAFVEKSSPVELLIQRLLEVHRERADGRPDERRGSAQSRGPVEVDQHVLEEHLERFREVFDQAAIGMATMTLAGTLVRANDALALLLGRTASELVGCFYGDITDGRAAELVSALERIRLTPVETLQLEHGLIAGGPRTLLATLAPVRDSLGRPLYVFLQLQDVTAERAALDELRRSEERFRLLVEAVEDYAIFMLDPSGRVVSWNAGAQRSEGYTAEEIIGRHFSVFYPPDVVASGHCERELEAAVRDGHYEEEGWRLRKDGSRFWASVLITPVRDHEGGLLGFAKVTRDTTTRRRLEQERMQALAAAATANAELESLNARLHRAVEDQAQFLAVTAHELRTPVGVLASSAELLSAHWQQLEEPERGELLSAMAGSTLRLRRLLEELLTASRLQASSLTLRQQDVEIAEVVAHALRTVAGVEPAADVRREVPRGLIVRGDRDRLAQIVENLVLNALRHGVPPVAVHAEEHDGVLHLRVDDEGGGVAEPVLSRLFERFSTGAHHGTGLGLFIVRELARAHGGEASYEPRTDDAKAAFLVTLPLVRPEPSPSDRTGQ